MRIEYFLKSTAVQMGGVLPYKWEACCSTNGRCTVGFPFLQGFEARKVQRYKWGAYCRTNWRCTAVLSSRRVGVGVSETLLTQEWARQNQTKERPVHELFAGAFRNKSSICESCLFSQGKHTRIHRKMGEIHMNFSFWPFFGLVCRGDS